MPAKIYPKRQRRVFLAEWREKIGLTQKQLSERLGCDVMTVSRWERPNGTSVTTDTLAALAEALGGDLMEPEDLYHHPDQPSPNQLMRELPKSEREYVLKTIRGLLK